MDPKEQGYLLGWLDAVRCAQTDEDTYFVMPMPIQKRLLGQGWMKVTSQTNFDGTRQVIASPLGFDKIDEIHNEFKYDTSGDFVDE